MERRNGALSIRRGSLYPRRNGSGGGAPAFSPSDRAADLLLWLEGGNWTLDGSSNLQTWTDKSAQGNNFENSDASRRPTTGTMGSNNVASANFSASNQKGLAKIGFSGGSSTSHTLYLAIDFTGAATNLSQVRFFDSISGRFIAAYGTNSSGNAGSFSSGGGFQTLTSQANLATLGVFAFVQDGVAGTSELFDGTNASLGSTSGYNAVSLGGNAAIAGQSNLILAGPTFSGSAGGLPGSVAEVIITNKADSAPERAEMFAYVKARVGI